MTLLKILKLSAIKKKYICINFLNLNSFQFDPAIISKIQKKVFEINSQETRLKKMKFTSLSTLTLSIELSYKYFNNYEAYCFSKQCVNYLEQYIYKLYGIEVKIPKTC